MDNKLEVIEPVKVEYGTLTKTDLIRLCSEKDVAIESYQDERLELNDRHAKELNDIQEYYLKQIKNLKNLVHYYERKESIIRNLIDIEQGTNTKEEK